MTRMSAENNTTQLDTLTELISETMFILLTLEHWQTENSLE